MQMSRYDYEQRRISDAKEIEKLRAAVSNLEESVEELTARLKRVIEASTMIFAATMNGISRKSETQNDKKVGRKGKLTDGVIQAIKLYRDEGMTQKEIAEAIGISIGLVNKACNLPFKPQA